MSANASARSGQSDTEPVAKSLSGPQGKRTLKAREGIDREKLYPLDDAVKMVKDRAKAKFDETIEIAMNLGVDPRHADQMVRGVVSLPNGSGRRSLTVSMRLSRRRSWLSRSWRAKIR